MKNLISFLFSFMFFFNLSAQTIDPADKKLIESFVKSNLDIQLEEVDQVTVSKVFSGTFYKIRVDFIINEHDISSARRDSYINVNGASVNIIEPTYISIDFPVLMSLIKKDFLLKDESSAKEFEEALNILYPAKEDDIIEVKHLHKFPQWIFIRGMFFDDYKAFIVSVDKNGTVTKVGYRLGYPKD